MKIKSLESKRLIIREINSGDSEIIVKWRSNINVYKYFLNPHKITIKEHNQWYNNTYLSDLNRYDFILIRKQQNDYIGLFGVKIYNYSIKQCEISYLIDENYQSLGYASEALQTILNFIKNELECTNVFVTIHKDNLKSIIFIENQFFIYQEDKGDFKIYRRKL